MKLEKYYRIKDECRKGLLAYLREALSVIPTSKSFSILDAGCGSGVPTMFMAEYFDGPVTAVDSEKEPLEYLQHKIETQGLSDRIELLQSSILELDFEKQSFDLILAEGILNVIGFETGMHVILELISPESYLIIHDDNKDIEKKLEFFKNNDLLLLFSRQLNHEIWGKNYYVPLEAHTKHLKEKELNQYFSSEMDEIHSFNQDPSDFCSMYYVLRRSLR